ncbi:MAG: SpoIIE family protein phosphatase [Eubacteriales bacterium]|nr:SpoIIE family protein phosphatase [Eubacteriales bacterium]
MKDPQNRELIHHLVDGMLDWVRVLDLDDNVIFINEAMQKGLDFCKVGMKCYEALGQNSPCINCTSRETMRDGRHHVKEEMIGSRTVSVMSSPIKNNMGELIGIIEVFRDVTDLKNIVDKLAEQNRELNRDLDMAHKIHNSLLPPEFENSRIKFSYMYKPCYKIGGDFLDCFMPDSSHVALYISDVEGKGIPASLLTVFLKTSFDKNELSPGKALSSLYKKFNQSGLDPHMYLTAFYSIIDLRTLEITYANAGHSVSPLVFGKNRLEILRSPGFPISDWVDDPEYSDRKLQLRKGDRILYHTDGLIELPNVEKQQFGEERLVEILQKNSNGKDILRIIADNLNDFVAPGNLDSPSDDLTMAILEIKA